MTSHDFFVAKNSRPKIVSSTGGRLREEHWKGDMRHRDGGPALIERCPKTGIVVREEYWREGVRHRYAGAAIIERNPLNGVVRLEEFFLNGDLIKRKVYPPQDRFPGCSVRFPYRPTP